MSIGRHVRSGGVLGVVAMLLSACAVAPTVKPGKLSDDEAIRSLQRPNQQRNIYFQNENSLFPRSREVLLSDKPLVVAQALLGQLARGPRVDLDGTGTTTEFLSTWKFRAASVDSQGTLLVDVSGGSEIAEDSFPLCQLIFTLIDGRDIRSVRLVDGITPIEKVVDANGDLVDAKEPITKEPCEIYDKDGKGVRVRFIKGGVLMSVDRQITGLTNQSEPLDWANALLEVLVGGPRPDERRDGFRSDVAFASPQIRLDPPNRVVLTLSAEFDGLPAARRALVLAQILDALESVPNRSFGAIAVQVGGAPKKQVPGPAGLLNTPIERAQYLALLPTDEASPTSTVDAPA